MKTAIKIFQEFGLIWYRTISVFFNENKIIKIWLILEIEKCFNDTYPISYFNVLVTFVMTMDNK